MSALLSQLEGRERRAECDKHDADLLADLRHRAAYLRQPEIADFRIGDLAQDVATELDRAHALAASHQRLKEALERATDALEEAVGYVGSPMWSPSMEADCLAAFTFAREVLRSAP